MTAGGDTGEKGELQYFVLKEEEAAAGEPTSPGLQLLERALHRTPVPGPGRKPRFLSMPHPGVCNSLLCKAAEVGGVYSGLDAGGCWRG